MTEQKKLMQSGIAENSIGEGGLFPDFNLPNAYNESRSLDGFLSTGPVIISFYRGAWCPYCNLEINALQNALPEFSAAGAQLVAITPQTPDKSSDQISKLNLDFEVLSDSSNKLAKQCGLVFTLPYLKIYGQFMNHGNWIYPDIMAMKVMSYPCLQLL